MLEWTSSEDGGLQVMCAHLTPMEKPADCSSYQAKKQARSCFHPCFDARSICK